MKFAVPCSANLSDLLPPQCTTTTRQTDTHKKIQIKTSETEIIRRRKKNLKRSSVDIHNGDGFVRVAVNRLVG